MSENTTVDQRLRQIEIWVAGHEAKCSERYQAIAESSKQTTASLAEMKESINRRMDWLLLAVIAMAVSAVIGVENFGRVLQFIRGG
jgi:hypothetical protein